eukprot:6822691-Prorocentrum_lima.AAC.1
MGCRSCGSHGGAGATQRQCWQSGSVGADPSARKIRSSPAEPASATEVAEGWVGLAAQGGAVVEGPP